MSELDDWIDQGIAEYNLSKTRHLFNSLKSVLVDMWDKLRDGLTTAMKPLLDLYETQWINFSIQQGIEEYRGIPSSPLIGFDI